MTPLIVWGRNLSDEDFYKAIRLQTSLTHCNEEVFEACCLYAFAVRELIKNPERDIY